MSTDKVADVGSNMGTYRRTQAGERKLALLAACSPARPSPGGQTPPPSLSIPAPTRQFGSNALGGGVNMASTLDTPLIGFPGPYARHNAPSVACRAAFERASTARHPDRYAAFREEPVAVQLATPVPCSVVGCCTWAEIGLAGHAWCARHARRAILSLENALSFVEGEG